MHSQELQELEKQYIAKLLEMLTKYKSHWFKLSSIEYELKLDKYAARRIARNLESKGFIEFIGPETIKIKDLGAEENKEYILTNEGKRENQYELDIKISEELKQLEINKNIFIIHGRDEVNLLKLEKLLKEKYELTPIILRNEPGKGRTIIEKFEDEAKKASFAFAIFTPDDFVEIEGIKYSQARPNTIFELGWFFGYLKRKYVCILCKKGTKIHSDLEGINRIDFENSVEEKILDIERELKDVGLINN